ncbi:ribonuclease Z [Pseudomonas sp. Ost2]|uniref:MBL fold metallo-hydrolase n=1 Tax=Pseudomonas TaxID=286 RepID=UPI0015A2F1CC|nr:MULTISPECIES: MBL fold metallo-hydrolase [Pseudomonas]NWE45473.1 MBL fold metallo-hydrolase [Pseudomonas gingeri]NWE67078.1 MBL fold metallo-hydrolase [Pseudomonas gingeri]BBP77515.1 ribonuclease Z [Pseudomonas sp. Ost2]
MPFPKNLLLGATLLSLLLGSGGLLAAQETPAPAALEMLVLGSGGPGANGRAGAGYALLLDGTPRILVDAGPGTFARIGEARLDLRKLDIVLLTHLHVDHAAELPGIIKARAVSTRTDIDFRIFGPGASTPTTAGNGKPGARFPATSQFVDLLFGTFGAFSYLEDFAGHVNFDVTDLSAPTSTDDDTPQVILDQDGLLISATIGHHGDAPAVIYRVDYKGKSITFSGDIDTHGHAALARIAKGSQLLVFNDPVLDPPSAPPILYTLHSAPVDIGRISHLAGITHLLLSHLPNDTDEFRDAASRSIRQNYRGPLDFAEDGQRIRP